MWWKSNRVGRGRNVVRGDQAVEMHWHLRASLHIKGKCKHADGVGCAFKAFGLVSNLLKRIRVLVDDHVDICVDVSFT